MTDDLSPAEEARLRRLLARSRHDEKIPNDVAARLDDVLTRLSEEQGREREGSATVTPLAGRRRRATSLLVAAAAVVVAGVGISQGIGGLGDLGGGEAMTAGDAESGVLDRSTGRDGGAEIGASTEDAPEDMAGSSALTESAPEAMTAMGEPLIVDGRLTGVPEERFTAVAERLRGRLEASGRGTARRTLTPVSQAPAPAQRAWQACAPTVWEDGVAIAVRYEGDVALLVFRTPAGDSQVVELLQCGTGEVLRSATLAS